MGQGGGGGGPYANGPHGNGPYGNGPHGWGGHGGWGGWTPPSPPKPGVIPLGPLRTSDILSGAFATISRYWKQLLGTALAVYGTAALAMAGAALVAYLAVGDHLRTIFGDRGDTEPPWAEIRPVVIAFACFWLFGVLLATATNAAIQTACPVIVQQAVLGRPVTIGEVARRTGARLPSVLGAVLLTFLTALPPAALFLLGCVGLLFVPSGAEDWPFEGPKWLLPVGFLGAFALMPLAVWLWTRFCLAPSVAVIESSGPVTALRRSAELVRGAWWRIFGVSLLGALLAGMAGALVQQVVNVLGMLTGQLSFTTDESGVSPARLLAFLGGYLIVTLVVGVISQAITATFPQLVLNLLYVDQRIRNENLGPVLATAASTSPTSTPTP
ncbi:hypothetical protein [Streptomyces sp. NBC_01429]|uniref:hypothetical protein n=1 Tax=Streptomyces sp. NBC_01429 TaxID=2903862 RepID=UPI002E2AED31|nr:hypothetical protein [Streptomyces sp. NBC_01429]